MSFRIGGAAGRDLALQRHDRGAEYLLQAVGERSRGGRGVVVMPRNAVWQCDGVATGRRDFLDVAPGRGGGTAFPGDRPRMARDAPLDRGTDAPRIAKRPSILRDELVERSPAHRA